MDSNEERIQKHVVVNSPGQRSEVLTERVQSGPRESRVSAGTVAIVAVLAICAIVVVLYIVVNRNTNEAANRNANLEAASQTNSHQPTTIVQQPAPVIIQQPASGQQAPVIVQQPAPLSESQNTSANDDAGLQDIATKKVKAVRGVKSVDNQIVVTG